MQIHLKQSEICQALRMYIMSQGISLAGREATMSFTAGRKESGISVEIDIEEAPELPEFLMMEDPEETPGLKLVSSHTEKASVISEQEEEEEEEGGEENSQSSLAPTAESTGSPKPAASLFG